MEFMVTVKNVETAQHTNLEMPCTREELLNALELIGIGKQDAFGFPMTEWEFTIDEDWAFCRETDSGENHPVVFEAESIDAANYLAYLREDLCDYDSEMYFAIAEWTAYNLSGQIEAALNVDNYNLYPDITTDEELGYYWIEESGCYDLSKMGNLANYFDYEAFGCDIRLESEGGFTSYGWLECVDSCDRWDWDGEVPEEYVISRDLDEEEEE